jgi:hypothetical protein
MPEQMPISQTAKNHISENNIRPRMKGIKTRDA